MSEQETYRITEELQRLRLRLLDLTARNRLLNFKASATKSIQVVGAVPNAVYDRLLDGRSCTFLPVPDPQPMDYILRDGHRIKPEAREYARQIGIDTSYELPPSRENVPAHGREGSSLRALYYPEDLERQCRRIAREAQSAIEETGSNMLYLVLGFLEFYEADESERPLNAPLIAIPVSLRRGRLDTDTRLYQYELAYTGEEISQNLSLREKLRQDVGIELPELGEEERPEDYFTRIGRAISRKPRWKVKRQITLALLSFAKMLLVRDLDPNNWPNVQAASKLIEHPIIQKLFRGGGEDDGGHDPGPYPIDDLRKDGPSLEVIFDADTTQHSALIDALQDKNLVVIGPPGTGKSQTITNLIALAMRRQKKVLFVSEKLAALEVVKHRLEQAGLGDFCLEVHSNKIDKKRVVEELKKRTVARYAAPRELGDKLQNVEERRKRLRRYADSMNSKFGYLLDLSVFEIIWRAERYRQQVGPEVTNLEDLLLENGPVTDSSRLDEMRRAVSDLAQHYQEIGSFGPQHPWYGFFPQTLSPGVDLAIQRALEALIQGTRGFDDALKALCEASQCAIASEQTGLKALLQSIGDLPEPGLHVKVAFLPRLFTAEDPMAHTCQGVIDELKGLCEEANSLVSAYDGKLVNPAAVTETTLIQMQTALERFRGWQLSNLTCEELEAAARTLRKDSEKVRPALNWFGETAARAELPFDGTSVSIERLHGIVSLADQAPPELLRFRHPGLNDPLAGELVKRARSELSELINQRHVLDELFWLDDDLDELELQQAIRTLRRGGAWYRFLQSDWRRACHFYKTLVRHYKAKTTAADRLNELSELARHLTAWRQFRKSRTYAETFGPLFQGAATDFGKVVRLIAWFESGREALIQLDLSPEEFDLVSFDSFRLLQLASFQGTCQSNYETVRNADNAIGDLLRNTGACPAAIEYHRPWTERLTALEAFLVELEGALRLLEWLGQSNITPEQLLAAVSARSKYIALVQTIETHALAKQQLGEHFAGLKTDFQCVFETIAWGQQVARAGLPEATTKSLLSSEARDRLSALKRACSAMQETMGFEKRLGEALGRYGAFNWNKWMSVSAAADGQAGTDLVRARASMAIANMDSLLPWVQYNFARDVARKLGLSSFAERLESGRASALHLEDAFLFRFYASIAQSIFRSNRDLLQFAGVTHERARQEFVQLDNEVISLRGKECAAEIARSARPPAGLANSRIDERTEMALLKHLMALQRPRTPIRQMMRRAGRAILELKPCFMMSPLSVAQYLDPNAVEFDLVVMDEASQLKTEESLGAIARGKQLVVVGDPKQLPPTTFFDRMMEADEEEEEATTLTASESILDLCQPVFPKRMLKWHYRSKHESLIAFSNHHFHGGQLIVFPSAQSALLGVRYHHIGEGIYQNRQNPHEAKRVVDAILDHMRRIPGESLGVVTLNITQRDLIEELLEQRLRNYEECERYKAYWQEEGWPFFVKNLENVQGDERDVIFICTTFGRPPGADVVRQNFGPISRPMGWRRLNVLFTRARKRVHVYSSMRPEDIIVDGTTPEGTVALKNYLEYAASGILIGPAVPPRDPDSDFEIAVADLIRSKGYEVRPQLGVAGFFIDIAVRNPDRLGEFLAAVECDGATYHSGASVRDRDRIRQEILESLGWRGKIWRIWSADWFRNPQNEIRRLFEFLEACRAAAAHETGREVLEPEVQEAEEIGVRETVTEQVELGIQAVDENEELFVEVGDTVTYCDVKDPDQRKQVLITDGASDFEQGIINERTPLAKTLINAAEGEEVELGLPGRESRMLRVLKIERNN